MDEFSEFFSKGSPVQILNKTTKDAPLLVGRKLPNVPGYIHLQQENPKHRLVVQLAAEGVYTNKEIAERVGLHEVTVGQMLRAPLLQQGLVNTIQERVNEDRRVVEVIRDNVVLAVQTLANIVKDNNARNADRITAAEKLLERRYGKANQPINRGSDVDLNNLADEELAKMMPQTTQTGTNHDPLA